MCIRDRLYTVDRYFVNEDEDAFCAGGLKITAKLLAEAMHSLPEEKRQAVLPVSYTHLDVYKRQK